MLRVARYLSQKMGCFGSKPAATGGGRKAERADQRGKLFTPPKWKSDEPMTQAQLEVRNCSCHSKKALPARSPNCR